MAGVGPYPEQIPLQQQGVDILGLQHRSGSGRALNAGGGIVRRVIAEEAAGFGANIYGAVLVLGKAANHISLPAGGHSREGMFCKLPRPGRDIIHPAIESSDPNAPFVVFYYRVDKLVGEGGGVAAVVGVEFPLSGKGVYAQQAVVAAHKKTPVRLLQYAVDVCEALAVGDLAGHSAGGGVGPVEAAVPGADPYYAVAILSHCAYARGRAIFICKAGLGKSFCGKIEHQHPFAGSLAAHPQAAVGRDKQIVYERAREIMREPLAVVAVEPVAECSQPDGAAAVLRYGGHGGLRQNLQRAKIAAVVEIGPVVGAHPHPSVRGLSEGVDIAAAPFAQVVPDKLLTVEAVEPFGGAYPDDAGGVLQQRAHGVGREPLL